MMYRSEVKLFGWKSMPVESFVVNTIARGYLLNEKILNQVHPFWRPFCCVRWTPLDK